MKPFTFFHICNHAVVTVAQLLHIVCVSLCMISVKWRGKKPQLFDFESMTYRPDIYCECFPEKSRLSVKNVNAKISSSNRTALSVWVVN